MFYRHRLITSHLRPTTKFLESSFYFISIHSNNKFKKIYGCSFRWQNLKLAKGAHKISAYTLTQFCHHNFIFSLSLLLIITISQGVAWYLGSLKRKTPEKRLNLTFTFWHTTFIKVEFFFQIQIISKLISITNIGSILMSYDNIHIR